VRTWKECEPTYLFGNTVCHKEKYGVNGNVAKILIRYDLLCFVFICEEHLCMNYVCLSEVLRTKNAIKMGSMVNCGFSQNFIIYREPFGYFVGPYRLSNIGLIL
jgi:hypothetical protein